ncbi:helix-turn-helix domain-containing protein [Streptomycetaceae bacterium NBC_01309]
MKPSQENGPPVPPGPYLTTEEFAALAKVEPATVRTWRHRGYGPNGWFRMGRKAVVPVGHVEAWLRARQYNRAA